MTPRRVLLLMAPLALALFLFACSDDPEKDTPPTGPDPDPGDTSGTQSGPWYTIPEYSLITETPCFVNIMFPVVDDSGSGIDSLTASSFLITENGSPLSPTESALHLRRPDSVPYSIKTVLAIDNSHSVEGNLNGIKQAAIGMVGAMLPYQEMAIILFSEELTLLQEFTSDPTLLNDAINSIDVGYGGTNLNGAIISGLGLWEDVYDVHGITRGFLVVLTDGVDTAGRRTQADVLLTRGNRRVFTIGMGGEIDQTALNTLGNSGFYVLSSASQLQARFLEIQAEIVTHANSFYWLNYMSPKRGPGFHTIEIRVRGNRNTGTDRLIADLFGSGEFYGMPRGLYVNADETEPAGIDTLNVNSGAEMTLVAVSYMVNEAPEFVWSTTAPDLLELDVNDSWPDSCVATMLADGEAELLVEDTANGLQKLLLLRIGTASVRPNSIDPGPPDPPSPFIRPLFRD